MLGKELASNESGVMANLRAILSCRHAVRLINHGSDRRLQFSERVCLRFHLLSCGVCRRYRGQLRVLRNSLQQVQESLDQGTEEMPAIDRERIRRQLLENTSTEEG